MKKNTKINLNLFNSNLNNKFNSIPFSRSENDLGDIKYLPPVSKEWKNTVYYYNNNNMKNLPIYNINANKIIKSYFNLHFTSHKFIDSIFRGRKKRRNFLRRIYTSKLETKHTNSNIIITLYTMNIAKHFMKHRHKHITVYLYKYIGAIWKKRLKNKIKSLNFFMKYNKQNYSLLKADKSNLALAKYKCQEKNNLFLYKYKMLEKSLMWYNLYLKLYLSKAIKYTYFNKLKLLRRYQLNDFLNKFKFERNVFLYKLNNLISNIYNNNVDFNIINLKSLTFNTDIFTEALSLKIKRKKAKVPKGINGILKRAYLPKVNRVIETSKHIKQKNNIFKENILKYLHMFTDVNFKEIDPELNMSKEIKIISPKDDLNNPNLKNLIFNSIKYKNMGGIRLEVKGRLTKRYRADRSIYRLKWKGGLKNIDSSYKELSTVVYRGYYKPNVLYSLAKSKRRIGAFAVKGWISGK